jgi:hypothetical protein
MPETDRLTRIAAGQTLFGPTLDSLVREVSQRPDARPALRSLVEAWPLPAAGSPVDADLLFDRLVALRTGLVRPKLPAGRPAGSAARAAGGLLLGGVILLPVGFLLGFVALEMLLPSPPGLAAAWSVTGLVTLLGAAGGAIQGARPTRLGHAAMRGLGGLLGGAVIGALLGLLVAGLMGAALGASQSEGAFAMGVVFGIMPLAGLAGGIALAAWSARRAWRGWDRPAPAPP